MANTQVNITENGTTVLTTAGKYCDRNIDVNVDVESGVPYLDFTNLLKDEAVSITPNSRISSTGTTSALNGAFVIEFALPANTPKVFRFRGCVPYNTTVNWSQDSGATWNVCYFHPSRSSIDEYGDAVWGTTMGTSASSVDLTMRFNLCFVTAASNVTALTEEGIRNSGAIVTINEPIGTGEGPTA